jgi:hypothetical protein
VDSRKVPDCAGDGLPLRHPGGDEISPKDDAGGRENDPAQNTLLSESASSYARLSI